MKMSSLGSNYRRAFSFVFCLGNRYSKTMKTPHQPRKQLTPHQAQTKSGRGVTILGIDPGTALVGWAVLRDNQGTVETVAYGHIDTSPTIPLAARLAEIARDLRGIVARYRPDEVAIEELFFFKNQTTVMAVSQARGAIILTLEELGVTIAEYTPLQVKQALTGYGRADKQQVQLMIKNILGLKEIPKPDDTADALAIALCHSNSRKMALLRA